MIDIDLQMITIRKGLTPLAPYPRIMTLFLPLPTCDPDNYCSLPSVAQGSKAVLYSRYYSSFSSPILPLLQIGTEVPKTFILLLLDDDGRDYQNKGDTIRDSQKIPCGQNTGGCILFLLCFSL